jgi:hypothetical protein
LQSGGYGFVTPISAIVHASIAGQNAVVVCSMVDVIVVLSVVVVVVTAIVVVVVDSVEL